MVSLITFHLTHRDGRRSTARAELNLTQSDSVQPTQIRARSGEHLPVVANDVGDGLIEHQQQPRTGARDAKGNTRLLF